VIPATNSAQPFETKSLMKSLQSVVSEGQLRCLFELSSVAARIGPHHDAHEYAQRQHGHYAT